MIFTTPSGTSFEIVDDWWQFAEMEGFSPNGGNYYPYATGEKSVQIVPLPLVEPPQRAQAIAPFKKYKLVPVLLAFQSPECALPPIAVVELHSGPYRYRVINGYHRYYASAAVGYANVPVIVQPGHSG